MMGGIFVKEKGVRKETMEGIVPISSTVRDEKGLGEGGASQDVTYKREGEKEAYVEGYHGRPYQ